MRGMQILQVLPVVGRPASKWEWCTADVPQVWQLEVPFSSLAKGPSMSLSLMRLMGDVWHGFLGFR